MRYTDAELDTNQQDSSIGDAEVLTLKSEQKKVSANMMTLNFGTFPKMTAQDSLV